MGKLIETLFVILVIVVGFLIAIGIPYALFAVKGLKTQVGRLETEIFTLTRRLDRPDQDRKLHGEEHTPDVDYPKSIATDTPIPKTAESAKPFDPAPVVIEARTKEAARTQSLPPKAYVFEESKLDALIAWLRENWVLTIAAASLALAGLFMVQYGVEHGVLTPFWRVMASLGFGATLIAGGEYLRRRFGDEGQGAVQYLPSVLSGSGIIVLFTGVLSARLLYGLIGNNTALIGLVAVSVFAMALGWLYGPVLAAIGVIGATIAPFVLSTGSGAPDMLYYYFALIAIMALSIDTIRRWAWISVLGLVFGFAAILLLHVNGTSALHFLGSTLVVGLAAVIIPARSWVPNHSGAAVINMLTLGKGAGRNPEFPTRLSAGSMLFASFAAVLVAQDASNTTEAWLGLIMLIILAGGGAIWMERASALYDHMLPPALGFMAALILMGLHHTSVLPQELLNGLHARTEIDPPQKNYILFTLVGLGTFLSLMSFWRMRAVVHNKARVTESVIWAFSTAVLAPTTFLILEFLWPAKAVIGVYPWALVAIALAAVLTLFTARTVSAGGKSVQLRGGLIALAALTMIAMALFLILSKTALSLSLAAMVLGIVVLRRRVDLPALDWFAQLGLAVISYRLIVDPGVMWAISSAGAVDVAVAYAGVLLFLGLAWMLLRDDKQHSITLAVESAGALIGVVALLVALGRLFDDDLWSHWGMGLIATLWISALLVQFYQLRATKIAAHRVCRYVFMGVFGLLAIVALVVQATILSPLFNSFGNELVVGPPIFDSLAVAYVLIAGLLGLAAWKLAGPGGQIQRVLTVFASLYAVTYIAFEIRRVFRGRDLMVSGVSDAELYAYTVAMLIGAGFLLMLAFSRRSANLRKIAMGLVATTIAKVFLIDMSGLSGLTRVFSFMGLGITLLGLTWVNRLMTAQWEQGENGSDNTDGNAQD